MAPRKELNKYYIDENCYVSCIKNGGSTPEHTHDFLEICYIFGGRSVHYINSAAHPVGAGDAIFINYGSTHRIEAMGKMSYADIIIKPEFISESLKGVENAFALLELDGFKDFSKTVDRRDRILHFSGEERKRLESLILLAHEEQEKEKAGKELMLHSLFNSILILIFRRMALPMKKDAGIGDDMLSFIKANCSEPLTLEEIAEANHYNAAYFSRLFKKQTGHTFTEYLSHCRIDLAKQLLIETELKVGDIAAEVGFSDRTKFFRAFAEQAGTTPLKYRKDKGKK